ncbi:unnamed protein product [Peronospora farinosa]|uniref:Uncharacterized protein n=1 Tax=Peronospora farinosa TaxID=134698 RepID=A0AAV0U0C1_9STRA|nr:unnamed protein product [Peronospora farinosa]CAI5730367.1 unnamed protein product [Peronospora farinosa]
MGIKKRQRSESFQAEQSSNDNAHKRLAAFHERMFELPAEDSPVVAPVTLRKKLKTKHKTKSAGGDNTDDGEAVPMVKLNVNKKKEKKEKKEKKKVRTAGKVKEEEKKTKKKVVMDQAIVLKTPEISKSHGTKKQKIVAPAGVKKASKKKKKKSVVPTVKEKTQWHDEVDLLEQALGSMKEIVTDPVDRSLRKKHNRMLETPDAVSKMEKAKVEVAKTKDAVVQAVAGVNSRIEPPKKVSKSQKRKNKKVRKEAAKNTKDNKLAPDDLPAIGAGALSRENGSTATKSAVSSAKSRIKWKKSSKVTTTRSLSAQVQEPVQPKQDKPLIISETLEKQRVSNAAKYANEVAPKMTERTPGKKARIDSKPAVSLPTKAVLDDEKNTVASLQSSIAAASMKIAKKKNGMFLSTQNELVEEDAVPQVTDRVLSESEDDGDVEFDHSYGDNISLFSRLVDSAAREQWELVEVGRLVRLFAAEWDFERHKTARFLCETCPELVNVEFLEGLGVDLSAKQLVQVFEAGSGNFRVLMNKMASAVENGHLSVRNPVFVSSLEHRVALMESNDEVMELLHPLLESLSTVRDVGCLLKQLCKYWQLERKIALVQQVLLSNVFDDLDGNQDEILLDLPDLTGRLDFPSRLDQEDVDENGNLKGFLADDDSDTSGEEGFEEDVDEVDSEDDEGPYEGDTDSEEDVEISGRSRGRNQFIEDEADVGDEDDEIEEEERLDDNASSSSDSD